MDTKLTQGMEHGAPLRGLDSVAQSQQHEGHFGRMFRTLPQAEFDEGDLIKLASEMTAKPEPERNFLRACENSLPPRTRRV